MNTACPHWKDVRPALCRLLACTVLLVPLPAAAQAGDPARGETLAGVCAACHGPDGTSAVADFPSIGGQHEGYLLRALLDYQSGRRDDVIMTTQVAALSRTDLRDLAAFYAAKPGLVLKR